LKKNSLIITN